MKTIHKTAAMIMVGILSFQTVWAIDDAEKASRYMFDKEEFELTPSQLYKKGMQYYNEKGAEVSHGNMTYFTNAKSKNQAMRYLIPAALEGDFDSGVVALEYLRKNPHYPNSKQEQFRIASEMDKQGYPYGFYMLANSYRYGIGTGMNLDLAQALYEKVNGICVAQGAKAYKFLSPFDPKEGELRCQLASGMYSALKTSNIKATVPDIDPETSSKYRQNIVNIFNKNHDLRKSTGIQGQ